MGKGTFIKRMDGFGQKLRYKHYNGKKTNRGKGVGLRIMNFQGQIKELENFSAIPHLVFH